ncbi:hypothetical protein C8Q70DRAFT_1002719 [Cubamyces menziesii]|uniref:Yeast cell wall synthesis Kre9/Knh1-like N-terminal domain-containing protein n=1 Tax=Trametes cubensis TaxID=1111947 RepID=A0AAD7TFS6_9APHY|nr:hypothetical protein C8Q70DRAFT_1002719 [Cubamyces menziesii]KAJ8454732.1 hypothetical protein ONZ51_g12863 [Trametes cubensis]
MFASAVVLLVAAASPALGNLFMTSPVASTSWAAGQQQTISWKDDGSSPSLADLGECSISVYVGSQTQQTLIQAIATNVNVATTSSVVFTPDASTGENGAYYFIRVESASFKDPNNPQYPAEAFSSKYTMTGMTGTFDATVKAQIGETGSTGSTAATGSTGTSSSAAAGAAGAAATTGSAATKSGTSTAASGTSTAKTGSTNGAATVSGGAFACLAGVAAVALTMLL